MAKDNQHPVEETSKKKALKEVNINTKDKNYAGQTNGQYEQDSKHGTGQYAGAGEAPLMKK